MSLPHGLSSLLLPFQTDARGRHVRSRRAEKVQARLHRHAYRQDPDRSSAESYCRWQVDRDSLQPERVARTRTEAEELIMPLWRAHKNTKANRKRVVSHNIREMRRAGYPQKRAVAAALRAARGRKR